jgi:hypothetical protein
LVLDQGFALTPAERRFFQQNSYYDYGQVLSNLPFLLFRTYDALSEGGKLRMAEKYGIKEGISHQEKASLLLDNLEAISREGIMKLDKSYVATLVKYRGIIAMMDAFYSDMQRNNQKDTQLPHAKLRRLLKETEFLPDAGSNG